MKSCDERVIDINMYIDGELSPSETVELLEHTKQCEICRLRLQNIQTIAKAMEELPQDAPSDLHKAIMSGVAEHKKRVSKRRIIKFAGTLATAAAALLLIFGGRSLAPSNMANDAAMPFASPQAPPQASPQAPPQAPTSNGELAPNNDVLKTPLMARGAMECESCAFVSGPIDFGDALAAVAFEKEELAGYSCLTFADEAQLATALEALKADGYLELDAEALDSTYKSAAKELSIIIIPKAE